MIIKNYIAAAKEDQPGLPSLIIQEIPQVVSPCASPRIVAACQPEKRS